MDDYIISFYNDQKEKKNYKINDYFDCGSYGYIYKLDNNQCLKLFNDNFYFQSNILKIIKDLKLDNFYQIYDLLFDEENQFCGYTMKYYQSKDIDILTMPTEYTLDNLYRLYNSVKKLSEKKVTLFDCYYENTIIDEKNITIIDTDLFYIDDDISKSDMHFYNNTQLLQLFKDLYQKAGIDHKDLYLDDNLLNYIFNHNKNINEVEKKLIKYKYPIDYVRNVNRGSC